MHFMKKSCFFLWVSLFLMGTVVPGQSLAGDSYFTTRFSKNFFPAHPETIGKVEAGWDEPELMAAAGDPSPGAGAPDFLSRFKQGQTSWGFQFGYGYTFDLPPPPPNVMDRTNFDFLYIFPNWKFNLTGLVGRGPWQGALYWVVEAGMVIGITDPTIRGQVTDSAPNYVLGLVPFQLEYKFINPNRRWVPFIFGGAGGSVTDFNRAATEISTQYEFILNTGGGIEYYFGNGHAISFNYHFWHLSNSGIQTPNIGLNAHVFALGFTF